MVGFDAERREDARCQTPKEMAEMKAARLAKLKEGSTDPYVVMCKSGGSCPTPECPSGLVASGTKCVPPAPPPNPSTWAIPGSCYYSNGPCPIGFELSAAGSMSSSCCLIKGRPMVMTPPLAPPRPKTEQSGLPWKWVAAGTAGLALVLLFRK